MKIFNNKGLNIKNIDTDCMQALFLGIGLFETIKIQNSKPVYLKGHLDRLFSSVMEVFKKKENQPENISRIIESIIINEKIKNSILKILFLPIIKSYKDKPKKFKVFFIFYPYKRIRKNIFKLKPVRVNSKEYKIFGRHKFISYMKKYYYLNLVREQGFDEALYIDEKNNILETGSSNIFFEKNNIYYTPCLETGILPGIMRKNFILMLENKGIIVKQGFYNIKQLMKADKIYITNSIIDIREALVYE